MSDLVVFDCDGTLVDSQHAIVAAVQESFEYHRLAVPDADSIRRIVGLSVPEALARLLDEAAIETDVHALADAFKRSFLARRQRQEGRFEPLFPGMRDCLERIGASGLAMAIATGKSQRGTAATLASHGIDHHFLSVQTADHHPSKPHPAMLEAAMTACGAKPARSVIIGDTSFDMEMGQSAGARRIGVGWGYHPADALLAAGAEIVIETPQALAGAVLSLFERDSR